MVRGWYDRVKSWYGAGVTMSWYTAGVTILFMVYIVDAIWYAAGVMLSSAIILRKTVVSHWLKSPVCSSWKFIAAHSNFKMANCRRVVCIFRTKNFLINFKKFSSKNIFRTTFCAVKFLTFFETTSFYIFCTLTGDNDQSLHAVSVYIHFTVGFIWQILCLCFCCTINEKTFRFCPQIHLTAVKSCLLIHIRQLVLCKLKCSANILNQKESWPDFEFRRKITFVWVASCRLAHVANKLLKKKENSLKSHWGLVQVYICELMQRTKQLWVLCLQKT